MPADGFAAPPRLGLRGGGMARGALWGFFGEGVGVVAAVFAVVLLARALGPEAFGLFGFAAAAAAVPAWIAGSVFGRAALVLMPASPDPMAAASALLRAALGWSALAWAGFAALGFAIAEASGWPGLGASLLVAGSEIPLLAVSRLHRSGLTAAGRYDAPGAGAAAFGACRLGGALLVVALGGGPVAALVALAAARGAEIAWLRFGLPIPISLSRCAETGSADFRRLSRPFLLNAICLQSFRRLDILLLGALGASSGALGWYAAAQQVAVVPALAAGVLAPLATVARVRAATQPDLVGFERRANLLAVGGLALFTAFAGAAPALAPLLFGTAFAQGESLFAWLALGGAGAWLFAIEAGRASAAGDAARPAAVSALLLGAALVGHVVAIPRFGATGAAMVTGVAELAAGLVLHLSAPGGRRRRRVVETLAALGLGGLGASVAWTALPVLLEAAGLAP